MNILQSTPRSLLLAGCALLAFGLAGGADPADRAFALDKAKDKGKEKGGPKDAPREKAPQGLKYIGVQLCANCHVTAGANPVDWVRLNEFQTWRLRDKHSQAYAIL